MAGIHPVENNNLPQWHKGAQQSQWSGGGATLGNDDDDGWRTPSPERNDQNDFTGSFNAFAPQKSRYGMITDPDYDELPDGNISALAASVRQEVAENAKNMMRRDSVRSESKYEVKPLMDLELSRSESRDSDRHRRSRSGSRERPRDPEHSRSRPRSRSRDRDKMRRSQSRETERRRSRSGSRSRKRRHSRSRSGSPNSQKKKSRRSRSPDDWYKSSLTCFSNNVNTKVKY